MSPSSSIGGFTVQFPDISIAPEDTFHIVLNEDYKDFYGEGNENRNSLSTDAIARIFEGIMTDGLISPPACKRLRTLFSRSLDMKERCSDPENQIDGFLGEGLNKGTRLWSKAGWMSQARHDAAWFSSPNQNPMLLVIFCQGRQRANDSSLLPAFARELSQENDKVN